MMAKLEKVIGYLEDDNINNGENLIVLLDVLAMISIQSDLKNSENILHIRVKNFEDIIELVEYTDKLNKSNVISILPEPSTIPEDYLGDKESHLKQRGKYESKLELLENIYLY